MTPDRHQGVNTATPRARHLSKHSGCRDGGTKPSSPAWPLMPGAASGWSQRPTPCRLSPQGRAFTLSSTDKCGGVRVFTDQPPSATPLGSSNCKLVTPRGLTLLSHLRLDHKLLCKLPSPLGQPQQRLPAPQSPRCPWASDSVREEASLKTGSPA